MSLLETFQKIQKARKELQGLIEEATIIFVDLAESTFYKDEKGIEEGVEKVVNFNLDITKIIKENGEEYKRKGDLEGYEISKYIGDSVMAYFKGQNGPKIAVEIGIKIQQYFKELNLAMKNDLDKFKPKIGIDFGEVLFAQYYENSPRDPHGLIVDRAARIVSLAKPYQILISDDVNKLLGSNFKKEISEMDYRKLKGIKKDVKVREVVWDEKLGKLGIKFEITPSVSMISADEPTVFRFIEDNLLLEQSKQVDLFLYTYETLASSLRFKLLESKVPIILRILIRNPRNDPKKEANIKSSINIMSEIMSKNPKITFNVRFYNDEPLLRAYIFHKENNESVGLFGMYRYDASHDMKFVGAEYNHLIYAVGGSFFEKHLLGVFQSRFDYAWEKLTQQKAIIFDLDGLLIDSMPFYYQAWFEAFQNVGINIRKDEVYEREGEKKEITAKEVYIKYKGEEPSSDLIKIIIKTKDEVFKKIYKVQIFPHVQELLKCLKSKNIKLGLVTGSTSLAEKFQKHEDFLDLFDVLITGENTKIGKPMPDPYNIAVDKLGVSKENCCVIENAPLGIKSAKAAELTCFAVKGNSPIPDKTLEDAGACFVYKNFLDLRKHLVWADTNIDIKDFINMFKAIL